MDWCSSDQRPLPQRSSPLQLSSSVRSAVTAFHQTCLFRSSMDNKLILTKFFKVLLGNFCSLNFFANWAAKEKKSNVTKMQGSSWLLESIFIEWEKREASEGKSAFVESGKQMHKSTKREMKSEDGFHRRSPNPVLLSIVSENYPFSQKSFILPFIHSALSREPKRNCWHTEM